MQEVLAKMEVDEKPSVADSLPVKSEMELNPLHKSELDLHLKSELLEVDLSTSLSLPQSRSSPIHKEEPNDEEETVKAAAELARELADNINAPTNIDSNSNPNSAEKAAKTEGPQRTSSGSDSQEDDLYLFLLPPPSRPAPPPPPLD